jgi:DNA-binding GntR family transcriptional regulator
MICDRIAEHEPARAAALMYEHIMEGRDRVLASLDAAERSRATR